MPTPRWLILTLFAVTGPIAATTPVCAQQQNEAAAAKHAPKLYRANETKAISVTRTVLERQGYTVVRVERVGATRVVYYRRGNRGRGKGKGPLQKMVIRTVKDRVVFEETAPELMVDIDIKLRL
jgi:hypothetical protein